MGFTEITREFLVLHPMEHIAQAIAFPSYKLVARIEVSIFRHGIVFMPRAASCQTLRHAGTVGKIHVEVEKEKSFSFPMPFQIGLRQTVVFLADARQIFLRKAKRGILQHNGLHGEDVKALVMDIQYILREVHVFLRVSAPQVIVLPSAGVRELLEILQHTVIGSMSSRIGTHIVMDCFPSIQAQYQGDVVLIQPSDGVIVQQHSVGGQCELEAFPRFLFALPHIFRDGLDRFQIHQRLSAEKVDLAMLSVRGMLDDVVHRRAANLLAHHGAFSPIAAAVSKAVSASQIAVLRHHQAKGFHHAVLPKGRRHHDIGRKKLSCVHQFMQFRKRFPQLRFFILPFPFRNDSFLICPIKDLHDIVYHFVDHMHCPAVDIQQDIGAVLFEFMNSLVHAALLKYCLS